MGHPCLACADHNRDRHCRPQAQKKIRWATGSCNQHAGIANFKRVAIGSGPKAEKSGDTTHFAFSAPSTAM
jgi:hypothetical protein